MAGRQLAGRDSKLRVASEILALGNWSVEETAADLNTTNFESLGFDEGIIGVQVVNFTGSGFWNAAKNVYTPPPGIFPRSDGGPIELILNRTDNNGWLLTKVRFISTRNTAQVEEAVGFEFSGKSNGNYSRPAGNFP